MLKINFLDKFIFIILITGLFLISLILMFNHAGFAEHLMEYIFILLIFGVALYIIRGFK